MRLVGRPLEVYQYLEPLYNDYRKVLLGVCSSEGSHGAHVGLQSGGEGGSHHSCSSAFWRLGVSQVLT